MKKQIQILIIIVSIFSTVSIIGQENVPSTKNKIEDKDIQQFIGDWKGELTYLDYSSGKSYSMPCHLKVTEKKKNRKLGLKFTYPNEPKANTKGKIRISKNGTLINEKSITSKSINSNGQTEIFIEYLSKDGNDQKKALIRNIYKLDHKNLIIRKEVKFEDSDEWILRNEYNFEKDKD